MNENPLHSVSVAGVTFDGAGRVLLIKRRDNGQLQAPGGILELGETFEEGVAREVLEETGVLVAAKRLTGVYKNVRLGVVALVYRCIPCSGEPMATSEAELVDWFDVEAALAAMNPVFAIRVEDARRPYGSSPASRTHNGSRLLSGQ